MRGTRHSYCVFHEKRGFKSKAVTNTRDKGLPCLLLLAALVSGLFCPVLHNCPVRPEGWVILNLSIKRRLELCES
jgi:hypothetical protein